MNKDALVKAVASETGFTQKDVETVVNSGLGAMVASLKSGEDVELQGYFQLLVKDVPARDRRNPQNGTTVHKEASRKIAMKLGSKIKNSVK